MKRVMSSKRKAPIGKAKLRYVGSCLFSMDPAFRYLGRKEGMVVLEDRTEFGVALLFSRSCFWLAPS